jgi:hypothetical protein
MLTRYHWYPVALIGPLTTVPRVPEGTTVMTPKLVPAPKRMLTDAVVRMVLPGAHPLGVVAVRLGVRVAVGVLVGTVAEAVGVKDGELVVDAVGVKDGVLVIDGVHVTDGGPVAVRVAVGVRVPVAVRVAVPVRVGVAVPMTATY